RRRSGCPRRCRSAAARPAPRPPAGPPPWASPAPGCCGWASAAPPATSAAGADTVYVHLYDVTDTEHIALLGREVVAQLALPRSRPSSPHRGRRPARLTFASDPALACP